MAARHPRNGATESSSVVAQNVATIVALEAATLAQRTATERVADAIARTAGTAWFALLHLGWFAAWLLVNAGVFSRFPAFDPYPFSLLTLTVSLEAIFLTVFVLISQSRMTRQADRHAHLDLQINLLAEQESSRTVELLERIAAHLGISSPRERDEGELARATSVRDVVATLERTLPSK